MRIYYAHVACSVWSRGWLGGALVSAQCCVAFSHISCMAVIVMFLVLLLYFSPYQSFGWCKAIILTTVLTGLFHLDARFFVCLLWSFFGLLFGLVLFLFAVLVLRWFYSASWWPLWTVYWSSFSTASCGPSSHQDGWIPMQQLINAKHAACKYSVWIDLAKAKRRRKEKN